jgi:hypothetical protein
MDLNLTLGTSLTLALERIQERGRRVRGQDGAPDVHAEQGWRDGWHWRPRRHAFQVYVKARCSRLIFQIQNARSDAGMKLFWIHSFLLSYTPSIDVKMASI